MSLARRLALCLALVAPVPAAAQGGAAPSPDALQAQLQSWLANLLGPKLSGDDVKLRVTAEADHDRLVIVLPGTMGDAETTAELRPRDNGSWAIDAIRFPAAAKFTAQVPDPSAPAARVPTNIAYSIGAQDSHAVLDPTFATASSLDLDLHDINITSDNTKQHQEQHFDGYSVHAHLTPRDGRLDFDQDGTITGWRTASRIGDKPAVAFGTDRLHGSGQIAGIDRDHAAALLTAIGGLLATLPADAAAPPGHKELSPAGRAALRALIEALPGIITAMSGEETIEGMHVAVAGQGDATVQRIRMALDGRAPDGMLQAWFDISLDGMAATNTPPNIAALVPTHVELRPSVAGLSMADLRSLMLEATQPDVQFGTLAADAMVLFTHGGVTVGLDSLSIDLGPAKLRGHGKVLLTGPTGYDATAHITATGIDDLMQQARDNPSLRKALPVLAMIRGFARPEGNHLVWDIVAGKAGLTVNGMEMSKQQDPPDRHGH